EKQLAAIWQEVLGREKIGIKDDFFELGGHSLNAMKLISKILSEFDTQISLETLFHNPTIAQIRNEIDEINWVNKQESNKENDEIYYI
uniref:phosphopantetheine-binding protein n=1 Tax=Pseudozobellia sp. WGM2 TaxID=2787625 RepID=UPI001ADF9F66